MKIPTKTRKPFYSDKKVSITVLTDKENKISEFKINDKIIKVKNFDILRAWLKVEKILKQLTK